MQTTSQTADVQFAAFIGLDWADQKHAWALLPAGSQRVEQGALENTPEAIHAWVTQLKQRFGPGPIAIALEQSRGAVIAGLSKYGDLVLYPIHPRSSAEYRNSFRPSGAKSDPSDAVLLLELLSRHRDRLRPLEPDTTETRKLRLLVEGRRGIVDDQTALTNQLTELLKQIFPQALKWLDRLDTPLAHDFLQRWPTLQQVQRVRPQTLEQFFQQHNSRNAERIQERIEEIQKAVPATGDAALLEPGVLMIQHLVKLLAHVRASIAEFDVAIKPIMDAHADAAIVRSFPGAGPVMAPRLIATLGTNRERFGSAAELQCFTGIAPVTEESGKQRWVHWRWACSQFDRQTIHEWAGHSMKKCGWAREYYEQKREQGKGHHAAIRALGYKWCRILYRCWKDRVPYDEAKYLGSRGKRAQAVEEKSTGVVEMQWKNCGSFSQPTAIST